MAEDVDIPKVGKLPKKVLVPLAVGVAGFVAWRFWQAKQTAADGETSTITDGEFGAVDSAIPDTLNPYPGSFSSGGSTSTSTTTGDRDGDGVIGPGEFTNNGQWTDYVVGKLSQSDTWSYSDIVTALGNGLAGKPTSDTQQAILRAAVAVGGQPPVGSLTIVSGGNTALTVAPGNVKVTDVKETTAVVSFDPVSGATGYVVYRDSIPTPVAQSRFSPITVYGLRQNAQITFQVAALNSAGEPGPKSSAVGFKTPEYKLAKPGTPLVSKITTTTAYAATGVVPNADGYQWYINGVEHGHTENANAEFKGLKPKTKYTVSVRADRSYNTAGPMSDARSFTTK